MIRELLADLVVLAGIAGAVFGVWQIWPPAAWVVGGAALAFAGWRAQ